jgi:DNA-binding transcriptional ArsR family regulator
MTAGELADRFSHSWSTTTRHLQRLEAAGLVHVEKRGRERRYTLDSEHLHTVTSRYLDVFPNARTRPRALR